MSDELACARAREGVSAVLDGEDPGVARAVLDGHLDRCAGCRAWADDVARVNRAAALGPATSDSAVPDLAPAVVGTVRRPLRVRARPALRAGLLVMALSQLAIGLVGLLPVLDHQWLPTVHAHLGHEAAAFNTAIGAALCWVVFNTRRARGPLPLLAVFVAALTCMEALDLAAGRVDWVQSVAHLPVLLGVVLTWLLTHGPPSVAPSPVGTGAALDPDGEEHHRQPQPGRPARRDTAGGWSGPAAYGDVA